MFPNAERTSVDVTKSVRYWFKYKILFGILVHTRGRCSSLQSTAAVSLGRDSSPHSYEQISLNCFSLQCSYCDNDKKSTHITKYILLAFQISESRSDVWLSWPSFVLCLCHQTNGMTLPYILRNVVPNPYLLIIHEHARARESTQAHSFCVQTG
jgi:hypothetical protein